MEDISIYLWMFIGLISAFVGCLIFIYTKIRKNEKVKKIEEGKEKVKKIEEGKGKLEFVYRYLRYEDSLFTSRVNLFFVAQSLLFISYFTYLTIEDSNKYIGLVIIFLGMIIALLYLFIFSRHKANLDLLKEQLKQLKHYGYYENVREITIEGYANPVLGWCLPILFLIAWWIILLHQLNLIL